MRTIKTIREIQSYVTGVKKSGKTIGFVPTMGYLHEGHISLMRKAADENDISILSVFLNPIQFGAGEDLNTYPHDLDRDCILASDNEVDVVFAPSVEEMYPEGFKTYVDVEGISDYLCGSSRRNHFRGVATIVTKLFNITGCTRAYFGQKDYQQSVIIKKMVADLNIGTEIVICPIVREFDGLAMSSRNIYLNEEEREDAGILFKSLLTAESMFESGERNAEIIIRRVRDVISTKKSAEIEYVALSHADNLTPLESVEDKGVLTLAVRFGKTRLIDNCILSSP